MANGPFTEKDLERINQALNRLQESDRLIEQAQQAGLDVGDFPLRNREARERLIRIKQTFFPGR